MAIITSERAAEIRGQVCEQHGAQWLHHYHEAIEAEVVRVQAEQEPVAYLFTDVQSGDVEVSVYEDEKPCSHWHRASLYAAPKTKKGSWEAVFGHLGTPDEVGNQYVALQAENERLNDDCAMHMRVAVKAIDEVVEVKAERDALQAKLDELQRQEPVAWRYEIEDGVYRYCRHKADTDMEDEFGVLNPVALYAAPKVLEPLTIPADVLEAATNMQQNDYRGPLSWARKVIDFVAAHGIGGQR